MTIESGISRTSDIIALVSHRGVGVARIGGWAITVAIATIFLWFGCLKFIGFEQESLVGIVSNNPLISWLYKLFGVAGGAMFLGAFEIATGLLVAGRLLNPKFSALGGAMGVWSFFLTITCLFTTPGVIQPGYEGTLVLSPSTGAFLVKDIVLFSACLWIVGTSLSEIDARHRRAWGPNLTTASLGESRSYLAASRTRREDV